MNQRQSTNSIPKLSASEAAIKLVAMGIGSRMDFKKLNRGEFQGQSRPANIPANPIQYYDGFSSFEEFIEFGEQELRKCDNVLDVINKREMTFQELKAAVRKHNISTVRQWQAAARSGAIDGIYPKNPQNYYAEWAGWNDFLAPRKRFLDFDDARKAAVQLAKQYKLRTSLHWRHLSRAGKRPKNLPAAPDAIYPEFVSWEHWFGHDEGK